MESLRALQTREKQLGPSSLSADLFEHMEDGNIKLYLTWKALTFRRDNRDIFEKGSYNPLTVQGEQAESVIAFARTIKEKKVLVIVPRFLSHLIRDGASHPLNRAAWGDTHVELPADAANMSYRNIFTGEFLPQENSANRTLFPGDILQHFPVALLEQKPQGDCS